ncbi:POL5 protein, partial [Edolisoma coerulescens]|nr:POL5 protein [Edolisoma coerulescens]
AVLDINDMFLMLPIHEEDKPKFAFTWEGTQYTFNRLPLNRPNQARRHFRDRHSPTIAHNMLAEILQEIKIQEGVQLYQYIDDVLVGGKEESTVRLTAQDIWNKVSEEGIEVPSAKCQGPSKEVKFLGTWWVTGQAVIPDEIITKLDAIPTPTTKKELQQIMGTLGYWRNHVPGFSIIARPLYTLMRKHQKWEWLDNHRQALQTLIEELKTYQSLGPVHPSDP